MHQISTITILMIFCYYLYFSATEIISLTKNSKCYMEAYCIGKINVNIISVGVYWNGKSLKPINSKHLIQYHEN